MSFEQTVIMSVARILVNRHVGRFAERNEDG